MDGQVIHDIFVIGGGINGCGVARDAAGRGYSVFLAEMNDLASGTSSGSTKLIHGGLRYLEYYEFRLVREALKEREVIWKNAPHIVWPMRFVLPVADGIRPPWLVRLGLFLYDYIGGRKLLPATRTLDMRRDPSGKPLKGLFKKAFEYSDCWVNDARLVVLNARDAVKRGAIVRTRTKVVSAERRGGLWHLTMEDMRTGVRSQARARLLVNASGPWIDEVLSSAVGQNDAHNVRLVQGSHIVIRKKFDDPRAYFFQNRDGRIIFAIPYETDYTLIGTTDRDYKDDPAHIKISDEETDYLCNAASEYFEVPVTRNDIVWTYSAVRPLYDDGASKAQEATRDYVLRPDAPSGQAPRIDAFGGKITTYRRLGEHMLEKIEGFLGKRGAPWTANAALPGGDFPHDGFAGRVTALRREYPFITDTLATRLVRLYGTDAWTILGASKNTEDLGQLFGSDLYQAEVDFLIVQEWAKIAEDVLWRRTKMGLRLTKEEASLLDQYMQRAVTDRSAATQ